MRDLVRRPTHVAGEPGDPIVQRREPSGVLPKAVYQVFRRRRAGARRGSNADRRWTEHLRTRRAGSGSSTASSTCAKRPSNVTRSPASSRRATLRTRLLEPPRRALWNGMPNARNSVSFQPAPIPRTNRPRLTSIDRRRHPREDPGRDGTRAQATSGPSRTRSVDAARAASVVHVPRPAFGASVAPVAAGGRRARPSRNRSPRPREPSRRSRATRTSRSTSGELDADG